MATIRDLLAAGSIDTGDDLVWVSRIQGETHKATISPNGRIMATVLFPFETSIPTAFKEMPPLYLM